LDLTQIRYFLALARTLNFTRAAEACNVTQPALTKSIQRLEDEFGGPLILRERSSTQLTELGRAVHPLLQQTFDAATAAREGASQFHARQVPRLRIGLAGCVAAETIMPLVREVAARFPDLEVAIREGGTGELSAWLVASEIDVALTDDAAGLGERANCWSVFKDRVVAWMPAQHPLAACDTLQAGALDDHPLVGRIEPPAGAAADGRAQVPRPPPRHQGSTNGLMMQLVRAGLGVALSVERQDAPPDVVSRALDPPRIMDVSLAALAGRPTPPAVRAFMRLARARDWDARPAAQSPCSA
jgi:DNA-binding transcriptional LysR family regulator